MPHQRIRHRWYGLNDDEDLTEDAGSRDCFVHEVCARWEREANAAKRFGVRVVNLRTGLVLVSKAACWRGC